jgi:nucleoside-diphosphate-sugar epimerase
MKNILVTGGAGYVGTKLCNSLIETHNVTVVDYFWFGDYLDIKVKKLKRSIQSLTVDDLASYDVVIFLGGLSNDPMAHFRPDLNFIENSSIPTYLAYIAKQAGVKRFICASSCSVYGFTGNRSLTENYKVKPSYAYGISKLQCELGIMTLQDDTFRPIIFRKGTIGGYSPRMRYDLVVNTMVMSALTKNKIIINSANLWRPLIDIRDVIQGYILAIEADLDISGVYNLAQDNYTIGNLGEIIQLELIQKGFEVDLEILYIEDIRNYKVDISKIQKDLKFSPKYTPKDTVNEIMNQINIKNYDFTKTEYYNINTFKKLIS